MSLLASRDLRGELMDDPGLDPALHRAALAGLARINRLSGAVGAFWSALPDDATSVLDLGSGGGDVPVALARRAAAEGRRLRVDACDRSPVAVASIRRRARHEALAVEAFALDLAAEPLPTGYDVLMCSLLLHHLTTDAARELLRRMGRAARRRVLVGDLDRSLRGLGLAWAGTRVLTRSPVVHVDGPLSVRAAFTPSEAAALAREAGLVDVSVRRVWPCRWLLAGRAA